MLKIQNRCDFHPARGWKLQRFLNSREALVNAAVYFEIYRKLHNSIYAESHSVRFAVIQRKVLEDRVNPDRYTISICIRVVKSAAVPSISKK